MFYVRKSYYLIIVCNAFRFLTFDVSNLLPYMAPVVWWRGRVACHHSTCYRRLLIYNGIKLKVCCIMHTMETIFLSLRIMTKKVKSKMHFGVLNCKLYVFNWKSEFIIKFLFYYMWINMLDIQSPNIQYVTVRILIFFLPSSV